MKRLGVLLVMLLSGAVGVAKADVWDVGAWNDNTAAATQNELIHGSVQFHDVAASGGVPDMDWFRIGQKPYSSYEIVVDSTSATVTAGFQLERVASDQATVAQLSLPVTGSLAFSRSLRWENNTASGNDNEYVRVRNNICSTTCTANDVYLIRAYETTYAIPRFNNTGTQVTVIFIQNPTASPVAGTVYFWSGTGSLLASQAFTLSAKNLYGLNSSTITALAGQSGTITISNDARYGALAGKAVSLESSTGFSFDTLMVPIPK
jgi:hypothetical protein